MLELGLTSAALVVALAQPVPQIVRIVRTGSVAGISAATTWLGLVLNGSWVAYGLGRGLLPVTVLGVAYVVGYLIIGVQLVAQGNRRGGGAGAAAAVGAVACTIVGGWAALGTALTAAVAVQFLPQVRRAWRAPDLTGLSMGTYLIAGIDGVVWGAYGAVVGDAPLVGYGVVMVAVAVAVAVPVVRARTRLVSSPEIGAA